jgi:competence protein ComEA
MKYVWAGLAIVAAIAALFFRPPNGEWGHALPSAAGPAVGSLGGSLAASGASRGADSPWAGDAKSANGVGASSSDTIARTIGGDRARFSGGRSGSSARIIVYVAGEVNKPGVYAFASGARAQEALARAGGPKPDADLVAVNLAAPLDDGAEVAVPKIGETRARSRRAAGPRVRSSHAPRGHGRRRRNPRASDNGEPRSVDLNAADANQLATLPGLGPALAQRIVDYRDVNGPFTSTDELADVSGITPHVQEELANYLVVR